MRSIARFLSWFLLVPYFAVRAMPTRPVFTNDVVFAKRIHAQAFVAIIFEIAFLACIFASGYAHLLDRLSLLAAGAIYFLLFYCPAIIAFNLILNRERERTLNAKYDAMPLWQRAAFGSVTLIFTVMMLTVIVWNGAPRPTSPKLTCDKADAEVSAAGCSTQSAADAG